MGSGMDELDIDIAEFIAHEKYDSKSSSKSLFYFDIAVIRLEGNVIFIKYIRPACVGQETSKVQRR